MEVLHLLITESPFDLDLLEWRVWIEWKDLEPNLQRFLEKHFWKTHTFVGQSQWNILPCPDLLRPLESYLFVGEVQLKKTGDPVRVRLFRIDITTPEGSARALHSLMGFLTGTEPPNICGNLLSWRDAATKIRSGQIDSLSSIEGGRFYLSHPSIEELIGQILSHPQVMLIDQLCQDHLGCQLGPTLLAFLHWKLLLLSLPVSLKLSDPPKKTIMFESVLDELEHGHLPFGAIQGRIVAIRWS